MSDEQTPAPEVTGVVTEVTETEPAKKARGKAKDASEDRGVLTEAANGFSFYIRK